MEISSLKALYKLKEALTLKVPKTNTIGCTCQKCSEAWYTLASDSAVHKCKQKVVIEEETIDSCLRTIYPIPGMRRGLLNG